MFTGIIRGRALVESFHRLANGARLRLRLEDGEPVERGESIAVNGVCLTALPCSSAASFDSDLSDETLARTNLGSLAAGHRTNIERAMRLGDRLGGHLVSGHIDATGVLQSIRSESEFAVYRWSFPPEFGELVVPKGSIAVDGVSLTIVEPDRSSFGAALIPETLERTNLGESSVGTRVNLEFDMMAKFARNLMSPYLPQKRPA
jgi:riboflavin synthase